MSRPTDLRLVVPCPETIDRGYGRQSRVVYVGRAVNGPTVWEIRVSPVHEIDRVARTVVGVTVTLERHAAGNYAPFNEDPPRPLIAGPTPRRARQLKRAA